MNNMKNKTLITLPCKGILRIRFRAVSVFAIVWLFSQVSMAQNWVLKWQDNFENGTLDQTNTWNVETDGNGGGNSELQCYIPANVTIEPYQGLNCLVLNAKKETYIWQLKNKTCYATSGRLNSQGKVYFQYGKIESRMKLPSTANGLWPAFWFLGNDYVYDINAVTSNWPVCGEIDVMECGNSAGIANNTQSTNMGGALHWGPTPGNVNHSMDYTNVNAPYSIQDSEFHLYTLIWDADSIKMYLDQDKFPRVKPFYAQRIQNGANQPNSGGGDFSTIYDQFHKPFHIVYNLAVGGTYVGIYDINNIRALPADGTPVKMYIDYIRVYQKGDAGEQFHSNTIYTDNEAPAGITASIGAVTQTSAEFLLNGTDNSGSVIYTVSYNGTTSSTEAASGTQKTFIVSGLMPGTTYNFNVTAKDASGNAATTASIPLSATTSPNSDCAGISNVASQGTFDVGYSYSFETSETDVTINFELLDDKAGVVAYLWNYTSGFTETGMTNVSGKKFTHTLTGQNPGSVIKVACKLAFAGGLSVTKQLAYTVGDTCSETYGIEIVKASELYFYPNPVHDVLRIELPAGSNRLSVYDMIGNKVFEATILNSYNFDMNSLRAGIYLIKTESSYGIHYNKVIKK